MTNEDNNTTTNTSITSSPKTEVEAADTHGIILSIVKDNRYVSTIQELVTNLFHGILSLSPTHNDTTNRDDATVSSVLESDIHLISWLLYILLSYWKNQRSIGMEYVQIHYTNKDDDKKNIINKRSTRKNVLFLTCSIAIPYLIQRMSTSPHPHRNGLWNLFVSFVTSVRRRKRTVLYNKTSNSKEHLRGMERRNVFEEQRLDMLQRGLEYEQQLNNENELGSGITARQAQVSSTSSSSSMKHKVTHLLTLCCKVRQRLNIPFPSIQYFILYNTYKTYSKAYESYTHLENPTSYPTISSLVDDNDTTTPDDDTTKVLFYILRFHLALFYVNGTYPYWAYRLFRIRMTKEPVTSSSSTVVQPSSFSVIGVLVFADTFVSVSKIVFERMMRLYYHTHKMIEQSPSSSIIHSMEQIVPSSFQNMSAPSKKGTIPSASLPPLTVLPSQQQQAGMCFICMSDRKYPSIASNCGHVFCWKCIQHWCSHVRPECPMCRTNTRCQDIVRLYNYN